MSKVAIIGDQHISVRNGDLRFIKYMDKCCTEWILPLLKERKIYTTIGEGDLYDKRTGNDNFAVHEANRYFFDPLKKSGIEFNTLIGNHDAHAKNSIKVNSPELLLTEYDNILTYSRPITVGDFDFIPWICRENQEEILQFIENSTSKYCIGHFELDGFSMYKNVKGHGGLSRSLFKKYEIVFSGHYHTRSHQDNILYTGTPWELTWSDADDPKGIHIFDTETGELEFIQNPFTMFQKVYYDEDNPVELDFTTLADKFVRLYSVNMKDRKKFDKFVENINNANPHELKVIEEFISVESTTDDNIDVKDTPSLIDNYIDNMDSDLDKERLKTMMRRFYIEAQNINGE